MYTVGLTDGWCNKAGQNSVTRNPSDVLTSVPGDPQTVWRGDIFLSLCSAATRKSSAFKVKHFRFHLTSVTTRFYLLFNLAKCDVNTGSSESKVSAKGSFNANADPRRWWHVGRSPKRQQRRTLVRRSGVQTARYLMEAVQHALEQNSNAAAL